MKNRVAILLRCSTNRQDYDRQLQDLRRFALDNNFNIIDVCGEHITGKDDIRKGDRKSIIKLKELVDIDAIDLILISEVSRLSRDSIAGRLYVREFTDKNIPIYFKDKAMWTINPVTGIRNDTFINMLGFHFDISQEELNSIKTRFASGKRNKMRQNKYTGGVVQFGYVINNDNYYVEDHHNVIIILDIYNKYLQPNSNIKSVCEYIEYKYNIKMCMNKLHRILTYKPYHTGKLEIKHHNPDTHIDEIYNIDIPILLDKELFDKVQDKLKSSKSIVTTGCNNNQMLQRLIYCPDCGSAFSAKLSGGKHSFVCGGKYSSEKRCKNSCCLKAEIFDEIIFEFIVNVVNTNYHESDREQKINEYKAQISNLREDLSVVNNNINKYESQSKKALNLLLEGIIDKNTYSEKKIELDGSILSCKLNYNSISDNIKSLTDSINYIAENVMYGREYLDNIKSDTNLSKEFIRKHIKLINPYKFGKGKYVIHVKTNNFRSYYLIYKSDISGTKVNKDVYYYDDSYATYYPDRCTFKINLKQWKDKEFSVDEVINLCYDMEFDYEIFEDE